MPTEFAVAISGGRAGVPFPAVLEVLIMEVFMEVLREATIRLPQMIGGALSIVGVLVIGQAAVSASTSKSDNRCYCRYNHYRFFCHPCL